MIRLLFSKYLWQLHWHFDFGSYHTGSAAHVLPPAMLATEGATDVKGSAAVAASEQRLAAVEHFTSGLLGMIEGQVEVSW